MKRIPYLLIPGISCMLMGISACENLPEEKVALEVKPSIVYIQQASAKLGIDIMGGAIVDFQLANDSVNPFTWKVTREQMPVNNQSGAVFQGHFLCLGRWGAPTAGEMAAGVPHNGQAGAGFWQVDSTTESGSLLMQASAPLDGVDVTRKLQWKGKQALWQAIETVTNTTSIARPFNIVQHVTIGAPFLDTATRIFTNATDGFMQSLSYPNPHAFAYTWPNGLLDSSRKPVDLRQSHTPESYVSTHIFSDSIGWVVAFNPTTGHLLGYWFSTSAYPWINIWHQMQDGKPWAKGLEFGTTGIGKSYQELMATDTRFKGRASFFLLDAGEQVEKSYYCFLTKLPPGTMAVNKVELTSTGIVIHTESGQPPLSLSFQ